MVSDSWYEETAVNMGSAACVCAVVKGCLAYRGDDEAQVLPEELPVGS